MTHKKTVLYSKKSLQCKEVPILSNSKIQVDCNSIVGCGMQLCTEGGVLQRGSSPEKREQTLYWDLDLGLKPISATFFLCDFNSPDPQFSFPWKQHIQPTEGTQYLLATKMTEKTKRVVAGKWKGNKMKEKTKVDKMTSLRSVYFQKGC